VATTDKSLSVQDQLILFNKPLGQDPMNISLERIDPMAMRSCPSLIVVSLPLFQSFFGSRPRYTIWCVKIFSSSTTIVLHWLKSKVFNLFLVEAAALPLYAPVFLVAFIFLLPVNPELAAPSLIPSFPPSRNDEAGARVSLHFECGETDVQFFFDFFCCADLFA